MALKCEPLCQFTDRLFFTTFPSPAPNPQTLNRQSSEPHPALSVRTRPPNSTSAAQDANATYYFFTIEHQLLYLSFFRDWGPLNLAMVYKACIFIHELLEDESLAPHRLVLYSSDDPRNKANIALLMALYVMIVQRRAPWEAFQPIAELEFMPFRDAGRGPPDFNLNIQDCLWGVWKAMQNGLCDMNEFSVDDYEFYEKVENGDWNWITPNFIAFASPVDMSWWKKGATQQDNKAVNASPSPARNGANGTQKSNSALQRKLPTPFLNCLKYFEQRSIKLVIRLNTPLYDKSLFLERGIEHLELYFDDGTNPTDEIVRTFIDVSDRIIESGGVVAVHCKAGLGRTGTLIGAYLIWKYGFTANEAIAFMRIVRPGSVVGPQQQYMYLKQLEWAKWAAVDELRKAQTLLATAVLTTKPVEMDDLDAMQDIQTTPPAAKVPAAPPLPPVTPSRHVAEATAKATSIVPPGQPRKTPVAKRVHSLEDDDADDVLPALDVSPVRRTRRNSGKGVLDSPSKPTRVTRSAAVAALVKKSVKTSASTASSPTKELPPNKIPRLARSARTAATAIPASVRPPSTPSRLPTPVTTKRPLQHNTTNSLDDGDVDKHRKDAPKVVNEVNSTVGLKPHDAWITSNASVVVVPASQSGRPGLRPIRRRRSSFSSAEVVS